MEKEFQIGKNFYKKVDFQRLDECLSNAEIKRIGVSENFIGDYELFIDELSIDDTLNYRMWVRCPNGQGHLNYATLFEAYADLYRFVVGDLDFGFEEGWLTDKIYKYKTE